MTEEFKYQFKIVIVGDTMVGKSTIINSFIGTNLKKLQESTIGIEYYRKIIELKDDQVKVEIHDTSGQEKFRSFSRAYYRNATGVILVYDISDRQSFENIQYWYNEIQEFCQKQVVICLVGNKRDLERKVSFDEGFELSEKLNSLFVESSATKKENINLIFDMISQQIYEKILNNQITSFQDYGIKLGYRNMNINSQGRDKKNYPCC